jgi:hypothetical protein
MWLKSEANPLRCIAKLDTPEKKATNSISSPL